MEKSKPKNTGKTIIFSTFLFGSLVLIFSIWVFEFIGYEQESQRYVRATMAIPTSEGFEMTLEAQPTRDHEPGYSGGGGGEGNHLTPTPTFDVDDWVPEEDLSDDLADE
jgi:hypothetical protein